MARFKLVALLTNVEGVSERDIKWASVMDFSDLRYDSTSEELIKGKKRKVILFETSMDEALEVAEATSMDGWYFVKNAHGEWDYWN